MVHRRMKRANQPPRRASHNRSWIWGRNVVAETLSAGRWPILELALSDKLDRRLRAEFLRQAAEAKTPVRELDDDGVAQLCRAADHQGCAARMGEFPYLTGAQFLQQMTANSCILLLDRIQDPFNFGAMIRTAECMGLEGIVMGATEQTGVNSQAARSSAGAVNHLPIARVDDLPAFAAELAALSWQIWGATERGAVAVDQACFRPPLALIIGNEGTGIGPELQAQCPATVQIPMAGRIGSLNAAVSAGILCYAIVQACQGPPAAS